MVRSYSVDIPSLLGIERVGHHCWMDGWMDTDMDVLIPGECKC